MPLYEYHCEECQKDFEKLVSFSEANQSPICPACQSKQTHKRISKVASFSQPNAGGSASSSSCGSSGRFR